MTLERRTQALLDLIEDDRAERCGQIERQADTRARSVLRDAHGKARADVRVAFAEERRRAADALAGARARLATQRRHAEQRRAAALLADGLSQLPEAFARRWRDAAARARWVDMIIGGGVQVLPGTPWDVAHPAGWPADEVAAVRARIEAATGTAPRFASDPRITAGLRIGAGGIVVDGTDVGLADDRAGVGARLLGLLEARREGRDV